ncbi:hypothetical protein LTR62_008629 [Meristemomyces frigidus]|uniref:Glutathione S-transferase kappa n=1 Tax=Meristemomyces frigidus TaxID=1508187 RepID=A0AAN7YH24_9PEZI|nr:hypothetical protein LTR62_008629 [Meristemomyces frigidus]
MAPPKITLYVDVVSPFAYMAWYMLKNNPTFKPVEITIIPIFLGGLMQACNNVTPISIKNKDKWIGVERLRWAKKFNIPMSASMPDPFPQMTIQPMRALHAVYTSTTGSPQDKMDRCLDALWKAWWVRNEAISDVKVWGKALEEALGTEEAKQMVELGQGKEAKEGLKKRTEEAFQKGAFGLPWFVCTNGQGEEEGFWGFDHMGQVVDFLGLERQDKAFRALL